MISVFIIKIVTWLFHYNQEVDRKDRISVVAECE